MLRIYNTFGRRKEAFRHEKDRPVALFTCGPSVYQPAHIGNFRTFIYEDILVRYLEYLGYKVKRGMAVTDVEDKAIREADKRGLTLKELTDRNIAGFIREMKLLRIKVPDYMPRASECVDQSVEIITGLIKKRVAYRHGRNIYFDPLKVKGFGKLFGLDMSKWPKKKRRFHQDTYPGIQWNLGDFILWNGCSISEKACWETTLGKGRPSWNVQDPSMVIKHFSGTLSAFCGGIDNLYRHHDYSIAIVESVRPYQMAKFWMHGAHLYVGNKKMSKSKGNILYTSTLIENGYSPAEIRFFLLYGHYRKRLNYTDASMQNASLMLHEIRDVMKCLRKKAASAVPVSSPLSTRLLEAFGECLDNDMDLKGGIDAVRDILFSADISAMSPARASGMMRTLRKIDEVLQVIF